MFIRDSHKSHRSHTSHTAFAPCRIFSVRSQTRSYPRPEQAASLPDPFSVRIQTFSNRHVARYGLLNVTRPGNAPFVVPPLGGLAAGLRLKPVLRTSDISSCAQHKSWPQIVAPVSDQQRILFDRQPEPWENDDQENRLVASVVFVEGPGGTFDYLVPDRLAETVEIGARVRALGPGQPPADGLPRGAGDQARRTKAAEGADGPGRSGQPSQPGHAPAHRLDRRTLSLPLGTGFGSRGAGRRSRPGGHAHGHRPGGRA